MEQLTKGVKLILLLNIVAFIFSLIFTQFTFEYLALHIFTSPNFHIWEFITSLFIHGGLMHLTFNMLTLVFIGPHVEKYYGTILFYVLYLIMGIVAGLCQILMMDIDIPLVGASGSLFGVFALFAIQNWNTKMQIMFIPIGIRAKYILCVAISIELFSAFFVTDNVGHFAHLGGAACGMLIYKFYHT